MARDILRRCVFSPYRTGPKFSLTMWATPRTDARGQTIIGYELHAKRTGEPRKLLFTGEDFAGSPLHADDSDACVRSLMTFLTLRPGDTDSDYFANYTPEQIGFAEQHAEALNMAVIDRFGEE